jgi:hypothetical protein
MTRLMNTLRHIFTKHLKATILATAAVATLAIPTAAMARDHHDRADFFVDLHLGDLRINVDQPVRYENRTDRVWVEPVYQTTYDRVWIQPVTQDVCDRVWVEPAYEARDIVVWDGFHHRVVHENVLVSPGHYEERHHQVVVTDGHWENVARQEVVTPGHWEYRPSEVVYDRGDECR